MININKLQELLGDNEIYHSNFQMDYFITARNGGNIYGMYKQALRELYGRYEKLKYDSIDIKLLEIDIRELKSKIKGNHSEHYDKERDKLNILRKEMELDSKERAVKHKIRELIRFYHQASMLKSKLGHITDERRDTLEHGFWMYHLRLKAHIEIETHGRISSSLYENIMALNKADRSALLQDTKEPMRLIHFFTKNKVDLPEYDVKEIDIVRVRELINVDNTGTDRELID